MSQRMGFFLGGIALMLCSATAMADDAMTGAELTALLGKGATIGLGGASAGYEGELALNADGTGKGEANTDSGDKIALEGTWNIQGDKFCRAWKGIDDGKEVCETWIKDGDHKVHVMVDGNEIGINHW